MGGDLWSDQMGGDVDTPPGPWERNRNWRSVFGWDLRRRVYDNLHHNGGWWWEYGRSKKVAREMLKRMYGPDETWKFRDQTGTHITIFD